MFLEDKFSSLYVDICLMWQSGNLFWKQQFNIVIVFLPIFVADTKIIYSYNFLAPLMLRNKFQFQISNWSQFPLLDKQKL